MIATILSDLAIYVSLGIPFPAGVYMIHKRWSIALYIPSRYRAYRYLKYTIQGDVGFQNFDLTRSFYKTFNLLIWIFPDVSQIHCGIEITWRWYLLLNFVWLNAMAIVPCKLANRLLLRFVSLCCYNSGLTVDIERFQSVSTTIYHYVTKLHIASKVKVTAGYSRDRAYFLTISSKICVRSIRAKVTILYETFHIVLNNQLYTKIRIETRLLSVIFIRLLLSLLNSLTFRSLIKIHPFSQLFPFLFTSWCLFFNSVTLLQRFISCIFIIKASPFVFISRHQLSHL